MQFSDKVKYFRLELHWSRAKTSLALRNYSVTVTSRTIKKWEQGNCPIKHNQEAFERLFDAHFRPKV